MDVVENLYVEYEKFYVDYLDKIHDEKKIKEAIEDFLNKLTEQARPNFEVAKKYYGELKSALKSLGMPYIYFEALLRENLLVGSSDGLGYLVFEIGVSWDTLFDLPVIPASGVKGVMRSIVEDYLDSKGISGDVMEKFVSGIFGGKDGGGIVGSVVFFNSYPVYASRGLLVREILNPHYNLVQGNVRSELDVMPIPIKHVAVARGVRFGFLVAFNPRLLEYGSEEMKRVAEILNIPTSDARTLKMKIVSLFMGAVLNTGLGSRTLKGFGKFKLTDKVEVHVG